MSAADPSTARTYPVEVSAVIAAMTDDLRALDARRDLALDYVGELRVLAEHVAAMRAEVERTHGVPVPSYLA